MNLTKLTLHAVYPLHSSRCSGGKVWRVQFTRTNSAWDQRIFYKANKYRVLSRPLFFFFFFFSVKFSGKNRFFQNSSNFSRVCNHGSNPPVRNNLAAVRIRHGSNLDRVLLMNTFIDVYECIHAQDCVTWVDNQKFIICIRIGASDNHQRHGTTGFSQLTHVYSP